MGKFVILMGNFVFCKTMGWVHCLMIEILIFHLEAQPSKCVSQRLSKCSAAFKSTIARGAQIRGRKTT